MGLTFPIGCPQVASASASVQLAVLDCPWKSCLSEKGHAHTLPTSLFPSPHPTPTRTGVPGWVSSPPPQSRCRRAVHDVAREWRLSRSMSLSAEGKTTIWVLAEVGRPAPCAPPQGGKRRAVGSGGRTLRPPPRGPPVCAPEGARGWRGEAPRRRPRCSSSGLVGDVALPRGLATQGGSEPRWLKARPAGPLAPGIGTHI